MRNRPPGVRHQKLKNIEFTRRQVYFDAGSFYAPSNGIEHNCAVCERHLGRGLRCTKSANSGTNSSSQLTCLKWFCHVVVGPSFQCLDFVVFTVANRQHKNRDSRVGASNAPTGLDATDSGHINVEEHGLIINHSEPDKTVFSVAGLAYIET
jgi:hypothetical protein